jgi:hypothetical protein
MSCRPQLECATPSSFVIGRPGLKYDDIQQERDGGIGEVEL